MLPGSLDKALIVIGLPLLSDSAIGDRMTAGNAIELILPGTLVLRRQIYLPFALSCWFETVPSLEGQESDLTARGYMLRIALCDIL